MLSKLKDHQSYSHILHQHESREGEGRDVKDYESELDFIIKKLTKRIKMRTQNLESQERHASIRQKLRRCSKSTQILVKQSKDNNVKGIFFDIACYYDGSVLLGEEFF